MNVRQYKSMTNDYRKKMGPIFVKNLLADNFHSVVSFSSVRNNCDFTWIG